jgi:hypothetical protein
VIARHCAPDIPYAGGLNERMDVRARILHAAMLAALLVGLWQGYGAWVIARLCDG